MGKRWFVMLRGKLEKDFVVTLWCHKNKCTYHWLGKKLGKFVLLSTFMPNQPLSKSSFASTMARFFQGGLPSLLTREEGGSNQWRLTSKGG